MPLMIKLNRNIMKVYLSLDNGHFITVEERCLSKEDAFKIIDTYITQLENLKE